MAKSILETLTQVRLKVEKDGKAMVDVPGLLALPGLLIAPKLSIAGMVAAPFLGLKVRLENEDGEPVDVEGAVKKAAEAEKNTAEEAARTIDEELNRVWSEPEETPEEEPADAETETPAEETENEKIVEDLEKQQEEDDTPVIRVEENRD